MAKDKDSIQEIVSQDGVLKLNQNENVLLLNKARSKIRELYRTCTGTVLGKRQYNACGKESNREVEFFTTYLVKTVTL